MGDNLGEVQSELHAVKKALRDGGTYLGMGGETLQRYFLQLNEKENLLLSKQIQGTGASLIAGADPAALANGRNGHAGANGGGGTLRTPLKAPSGPAREFDRDSLPAVVTHLRDYGEDPAECARGLRALSSLAYSQAGDVGSHEEVLPMLLRFLSFHYSNQVVQLYAVRTLCNVANDTTSAMGRLAEPPILAALMSAMTRTPESKEINSKASEAIARVVAAGSIEGRPISGVEDGKLGKLFDAALGGELAWVLIVAQLVTQFTANEVTTPTRVAQQLQQAVGRTRTIALAVVRGLELSKQLSNDKPDQRQALIDGGFIPLGTSLMIEHASDADVQLAGIEAMSGLVGSCWDGLQAFVTAGGVKRIEEALREHTTNAVIQTKGVRAIASGVDWPKDVQQKAEYSAKTAVELTKAAMAAHPGSSELQAAGLEALARYLDRLNCIEEVKSQDGDTLVKSIMTQHQDAPKVQSWGRVVLDKVGTRSA